MSNRFTIDGSDALENRLARTCERVWLGVQSVVPPSRIEALVLGGGYGRGEGGVWKTPAGDRPYNDMEFYVFVRGSALWNERKYRRGLAELGEQLSPDAGLHVEFKVDSLSRLRRRPVSMFSYDLATGHRVVSRNGAVFQPGQHHLDARRIPLSEATRLLFNRCSGLLLARDMLRQAALTPTQADFVARNLAKAQLALGDAVLTAFGQYHWSCPERHRRLLRLASAEAPLGIATISSLSSPKGGEGWGEEVIGFRNRFPSPQPSPRSGGERELMGASRCASGNEKLPWLEKVREYHAAGVAFKLHPRRILQSAEVFAREHGEISALALQIWLWLESRRLACPFASAREYAFSSDEKCPGGSFWRNYLSNLRTFGFRSALDSFAIRYPRERLFNALVLLLWGGDSSAEAAVTQRLQKQLLTPTTDWGGFVRAYKEVWPAYG